MKKKKCKKLIYDYENYTIAQYEDDVVVVRFTYFPLLFHISFICVHPFSIFFFYDGVKYNVTQ